MSAKDDADACATDLLRLYEAMDVVAMVVTLTGTEILVRCQERSDVAPLCRRVLSEYEIPTDRVLQ